MDNFTEYYNELAEYGETVVYDGRMLAMVLITQEDRERWPDYIDPDDYVVLVDPHMTPLGVGEGGTTASAIDRDTRQWYLDHDETEDWDGY